MPKSYQLGRSPVKRAHGWSALGAFSLAFLALLVGSAPAAAQSDDCDTSEISRSERSIRQLAVRIAGEWRFFARNREAERHLLDFGRGGRPTILCMAWEAPRSLLPQIVYASTRFTNQEYLSLFRRGILTADQSRAKRLAGVVDAFHAFHGGSGDDRSAGAAELQEGLSPEEEALQEDLMSWHQRSASIDLVSDAVVVNENLPYGSERLLTLLPLRPRKSWVRIRGQLPLGAESLDVVVAYSGDRNAGAHAYRYWFEIR